jgi:acyl carrier protein
MSDIDQVRQYIVENFLYGDDKDLKADTSFYQSNIIDSTGILELISFLGHSFDIVVEDSEMSPENFESLAHIEKFLEAKRKGKSL